MQELKRIDVGGRIQAEVAEGIVKTGTVTEYDKSEGEVIFHTPHGEKVMIDRPKAMKASQAELDSYAEEHPDEVDDEDLFEGVELEYDEANAGEAKRQGGIVPERYRKNYEQTKSANGKASLDNADPVAQILRGLSIEAVAQFVAAEIGVDEDDLLAKYTHLNPGQQRMVMGNRLRNHRRMMGTDTATGEDEDEAE